MVSRKKKKEREKRNKTIGIALLILGIIAIGYPFLNNHGTMPTIIGRPKYELQYWESKEQLQQDIYFMNKQIYDGECFRHWGARSWTWEHTECVNAQIEMADNLLEEGKVEDARRYLDDAQDNLEWLYEQAEDCTDQSNVWNEYPHVIGDGFKEWRCLYDGASDWLESGKKFQSFAHYVDVIMEHENKVAQKHIDSMEKFKEFVLVDHLGEIMPTWLEYSVNGQKRGCFGYMIDDKVRCQNHNRVAQDYDILLYAYDWTGNTEYLNMYKQWSRYFKATLEVKQDTEHLDSYYSWHYHDDDPDTKDDYDDCIERGQNAWTCSGAGEMWGYTNFDLQPVIHGYEKGIFWGRTEMKMFANTLTKASGTKEDIYDSSGNLLDEDQYVVGWQTGIPRANSWSNEFSGSAETFAWIEMAHVSKEVFDMEEQIQHNEYTYQRDAGTFWDKSYFDCVTNSQVDPDNPICKHNDAINPAWRFYAMVNIYKFAK